MSNPFHDPKPPTTLDKPSTSTSTTYPAPSGPPPPASAGARNNANANADLDVEGSAPEDAPPAYSSVAGHQGHTTLQAGPSRMDFSGPPPLPERLQGHLQPQNTSSASELGSHITGVGYGYGVRPEHTGQWHPPPPPLASSSSFNRPPPSPGAGRPRPQTQPQSQEDWSPTEIPTPGRPLLRNGQLLVYPKGHFCHKCGNTGYKNNDPTYPHDSDWRKYGKPYNSALSTSYLQSSAPNANPSTQASNNFQRPLPNFSRPPQAGPGPGIGMNGGGWTQHPGNFAPPPQPQLMYHPGPPPMPGGYGYGPPPPPHGYYGPPAPPPPLILHPGDPRIGGRVCWNCGGSGREISFFGFDDGKCRECRGIGRLF